MSFAVGLGLNTKLAFTSVKRILLADDQEAIRKGVRITLTLGGFEICGEARNGKEAVQKAGELHPDAIVLDITMPVLNGLDAARIIHRLQPETPILILSIHDSRQLVEEAKKIGVQGYVNKSDAGRDLVRALESVLTDHSFFPAQQ